MKGGTMTAALLAAATTRVGVQDPVPRVTPVPNRDAITARLADLRKIETPEGIEALEAVEIGGSRQWISIRGLHRDNPVLLVIHGGPGSPLMPLSWAFQKPWEDFFTVVQWDQRGVGKNFADADLAALAPTMTLERNVQDAEEMVAYLRKRLGKDRIVLMGFSWGTTLGTHVAKRRPEWLYAYVGVGQSVAGDDEKYIYDRVLALALKSGNQEAREELAAIAPYPGPRNDPPLASIMAVRKWARFYNGGWYGKKDFKLYFGLPEWAPEYEERDVEGHLQATRWAGERLVQDLRGDLRDLGLEFKVPIVFMMGRYDLHTPYEAAKGYFDVIKAPLKKFISFERSAHFPMFEEPGRFFLALVADVLPLAGGSTAFEPLP